MFTTATLADLRQSLILQPRLLVVALCADWCGTCREFRAPFMQLSKQFPNAALLWLDIEDDAIFTEALDVQDFPTLAIFAADGTPLYFGVSLPQASIVNRLITALLAQTEAFSQPGLAVHALYQALLPSSQIC